VSIALATLMLMAAQAVPTTMVSVCDIANGRVPLQAEVEVTGRYYSDFMHFSVLRDGGCQIGLDGEVANGPVAEAFMDATWRRRPFPDLDETAVTLRIRGHVAQFDVPMIEGLRTPGLRIAEFVVLSVREGAVR
jgi:hypothetical protein